MQSAQKTFDITPLQPGTGNRELRTFRIILIMIALTLYYASGKGQNYLEDFGKVRRAYTDPSFLSAEVEAYGYSGRSGAGRIVLGKGGFKKSKANYYSVFGDEEMISNSSGTLIIDHYEKSATWFDHPMKNMENNSMEKWLALDSSIAKKDSIVYKGEEKGFKHYVFHHKTSLIASTELFISTKTWYIEKLVFNYRPGNEEETIDLVMTEIFYRNISTQKPSSDAFATDKLLVKTGKTYKLTGNIKAYQLNVVTKSSL